MLLATSELVSPEVNVQGEGKDKRKGPVKVSYDPPGLGVGGVWFTERLYVEGGGLDQTVRVFVGMTVKNKAPRGKLPQTRVTFCWA